MEKAYYMGHLHFDIQPSYLDYSGGSRILLQ